jgi:hypothetical protein
VKRPWRATLRSVFQALVGFAAMWGVIVEAIGLDPSWQWVATSLAVTGAVTRVMALPGVEKWLERFLPFLAADPKGQVVDRIPDFPDARKRIADDLDRP